MKVARKTIEVGKVLKMANTFLAAHNTTPDERDAIAYFIEGVLFESGNYRGYAYLPKENYPDEVDGLGTRRRYFASSKIDAEYEADLRDLLVIRV